MAVKEVCDSRDVQKEREVLHWNIKSKKKKVKNEKKQANEDRREAGSIGRPSSCGYKRGVRRLPDCLSLSGARVLWISSVISSFSLTKPLQQKWWDNSTLTHNTCLFSIWLTSLLITFVFFLRHQDLSARDIESKRFFLICLPYSSNA